MLNCKQTQFRAKRVWVISVVSGVSRGSFKEDMGLIRTLTFKKNKSIYLFIFLAALDMGLIRPLTFLKK